MLVVDDEPDILLLVSSALRSWGVECFTADSAEAAWQVVEKESPDVLILDISMPYVSGVTFLHQLRTEGLEPPRVILLSALPVENLRALAQKLGVAYMPKPFQDDQLRTAISDLLAG